MAGEAEGGGVVTEQAQIEALAKLDGKTRVPVFNWVDNVRNPNQWVEYSNLPDYLHSRDAITGLVERQTEEIQAEMVMHLRSMGFSRILFLATSAQLCEALLRAINLWKD